MKLIPQKLKGWGYCTVKTENDPSFNYFWDIGGLKAENRPFCLPWPWISGQWSFKVIDFGTNGKHVYTFLLVINSNFSPILYRFGDMAKIANFTYPTLI